jgi:hypothetical protein
VGFSLLTGTRRECSRITIVFDFSFGGIQRFYFFQNKKSIASESL